MSPKVVVQAKMSQRIVVTGYRASSQSLDDLCIINGFLVVECGKITSLGSLSEYEEFKKEGHFDRDVVIELNDSSVLIPGFIDCHTHAPQFPNIGIGLDRPLLEWLDKYTFPLEKKYGDEVFAAGVYERVVKRLLKSGTTTACYFGSLHLNGTLELVNTICRQGQRAFVGKVSMNVANGAGYYNKTEQEICEVNMFIKYVRSLKNDLVEPVITPRFAVSCDEELMKELGSLAEQHNCLIQSHISENLSEIDYVLKNFPQAKSYADVYDRCKLLTKKSIMAHAVHLSEEEMSTFSINGASVAHCPSSNTRIMSGLCPVVRLLNHGITVGLGTDVAGGDNALILDAMRRAMDVSTHLKLMDQATERIDWKRAFYLATLGGAKALSIDHKIGSFEIGKEFDALIIDAYAKDSAIDNYNITNDNNGKERIESLLQQFIYQGDDRNIVKVFVKGKQVILENLYN